MAAKRARPADKDIQPPAKKRKVAAMPDLLNEPAIKALVYDRTTSRSLEQYFNLNNLTLKDVNGYLLLQPAAYDIVEFDTTEQKTTVSAMEMHLPLYSYIVNRAAALAICEAEGYIVREGCATPTDNSFFWLVEMLMRHRNVRVEERDGAKKRVLKIEMKRSDRASRILTTEPMRFKVQARRGEAGNDMGPVEYAIFRFTQSRGCWEAEWEYVSKSYCLCFYRDERYEVIDQAEIKAVLAQRKADRAARESIEGGEQGDGGEKAFEDDLEDMEDESREYDRNRRLWRTMRWLLESQHKIN